MPRNVLIKIVTCHNCGSKYDAAESAICTECGYDPMEADIYADLDKFYDEVTLEENDNEDNSI